MLDRRAPQLTAPASFEVGRLPAVSDNRLVTALTESEYDLPLGARLPSAALLIAEAIVGPPPTWLHEQFQQQVGMALSALALAAGATAAAASALSPLNQFNAFQQAGLSSSDPSAVDGVALGGARTARYRLSIERVACGQENVGGALLQDGAPSISPGSYQLGLRTRTGSHDQSVDVILGDTNEIVLAKVATAINLGASGISTTLAHPARGLVQLVLASRLLGAAGAFSVLGGRLSDALGAQRVEHAAQDTVYVLNGVRTTAPDNAVFLDGGKVQLRLTRAKAGVEHVISVGPDGEVVAGAVAELVGAASRMAATMNDNARYLSRNFANHFSTIVQPLRQKLAPAGIRVQGDNTMAFDGAVFRAALAADRASVETVITSSNGVAQVVGRFAADIISAPISRYGAPEFIPPVLPRTSHPTPQMLLASNSLSALLYAQLFSQGLFINTLF